MLLFGLAPALRASAVKPASALKGGGGSTFAARLMHALIAAQVAFCFLVLFVAGLFAATFDRLSHRPLGFSPERLLTLDTVAQRAEPPVFWDQVADHLRQVAGRRDGGDGRLAAAWRECLERLCFGERRASGPGSGLFSECLAWLGGHMKIPLDRGRDFRPNETLRRCHRQRDFREAIPRWRESDWKVDLRRTT